jgi:O-antigen/teichoic acid export membrane protein
LRAGQRGGEPDVGPILAPRWEVRLICRLAILTLPLGVMVLLQSLNTNIPRFLIERHLGEHALGIFAALAYVMVAGTTLIRALGHSASPALARYYNGGERMRFYRFNAFLVAAGAGIGLAGIGIAVAAGPWILRVMYTPEYSRHAPLFVSLMLAALFQYVAELLDFSVAVVRWFPAQMVLAAFVSVLTLVMGIWLIPRAGLLGASQALLWGGVAKVVGNLAILGFAARAAARGAAPEPLALEMDPS